jgi:hypothetical protein
MPIIPTLGKLRQDYLKFKASLGYIMILCQKNKQINNLFVVLSFI